MTGSERVVLDLLGKYRVQKHYQASRTAGSSRYAVYVGKGEQVTEPKPFADARDEARTLTARDIVSCLRDEAR